MPEGAQLAKAKLIELDADFMNPKPKAEGGREVTVQFNPDTLKVTFANQIVTPNGSNSQNGGAAQQFVGAGTTKLAVVLWFDVHAPQPADANHDDVRDLTKEVAYFITPQEKGKNYIPPATRFLWGTFSFDGIVEGMEETLDLFSAEGRPLRASIAFTLSQQKIQKFSGGKGKLPGIAGSPGTPNTAGILPLASAPQGLSLQQLLARLGRAADLPAVASANGIENPRVLAAGQLIDLNVRRR